MQFDNPEAIDAQPATPFFTAFTGLTRQMQVDAVPAAAGPTRATFRLTGGSGEFPRRCCGPSDTSAGPTLLALGPTAVRLQTDATDAATVVDSTFRGQGYDHVLFPGAALTQADTTDVATRPEPAPLISPLGLAAPVPTTAVTPTEAIGS